MKNGLRRRHFAWLVLTASVVLLLISAGGATAAGENSYVVHNLVSDVPGLADHTDASLVNAWGLTAQPGSPWWVANNGTSTTTLYRADGSKVVITTPDIQVPNDPTGAAANTGPNFVVTEDGKSGPARFLFDTEEGKILGWNPAVAAGHAVVAKDRSDVGAIYKGLALGNNGVSDFLYATDFHNARVDMFDGAWNLITAPGTFVDPHMPAGYAPFGIANLGGTIFVSYAKKEAPDATDELHGQGLGLVDAFDVNGTFLRRVINHGQLNAPWGMAQAPAGFGAFGGDLLVGNFGNGEINAYQPNADGTYERVGQLRNPDHSQLAIDGLWAIVFGKGSVANNGPTDTLFFTAGPDDESHGLFGTIRAG
jgi:uncharacterized protein (TIGR03118 family)